MQFGKVSSDELSDLGFDKDEIALVHTADPVPAELEGEMDYSNTVGVPVFDGEKIVFNNS